MDMYMLKPQRNLAEETPVWAFGILNSEITSVAEDELGIGEIADNVHCGVNEVIAVRNLAG